MNKKLIILFTIVALGCSLLGGAVGALLIQGRVIEMVTPQWLSRFTRLIVDSNADVPVLVAQAHTAQTAMVLTVEDSSAVDKFTVDNEGNVSASGTLSATGGITSTGNMTVTGHLLVDTERDSDLSGYEYFQTIQGDISGTEGGAKTYGLYINMTRPAGKENNGGDIDDAGLKIRVDTEAVAKTAGITLRALDAEAKADNPSGTTTNLVGGQITAKSDTGAGTVTNMTGLFIHAQNNAEVSTLLVPLDVRLFRQAAVEPTGEYVARIRNSSSSGGGCDAGIYFSSDGSGETDDFDYVIDMSGADVDDADIRLSQGETIANTTDGIIGLGGKMTIGAFGSPHDVSATREHGVEVHFSGNDYNVTGLRSRASLITSDASTRSAQGALLQAANADGVDAGVLNGALIEAIGKSSTSAATISTMRGLLVNTEWDANDTVTNLKAAHVRSHTRNNAGAGSFGTGYLLYLENEAVGGNGQQFDAGIYFEGTNLSGGNKAFDYCIDMSGIAGEVGTADIRLSNGETIKNTTDGVVQTSSFFAFEKAGAIDLGAGFTIAPTASYQPVTVSGAGAVTSDGTTAIADGSLAGQMLIIINEDDQNVILQDGANILCGGAITLAANADDSVMLIWDGSDWVCLGFHSN